MIFIFSGPHMPLGDICSGISLRYDDSISVALAEPWDERKKVLSQTSWRLDISPAAVDARIQDQAGLDPDQKIKVGI